MSNRALGAPGAAMRKWGGNRNKRLCHTNTGRGIPLQERLGKRIEFERQAMTRKRKAGLDPAVSKYFAGLARRRNAGRTVEEKRAQYYANGLDKHQFPKGKRVKEAQTLPPSAPNEQPTPPASAAPVAPALSWEERRQNRERWEEMNRQAEEIRLQDEQERIRQELNRARSVRPKPLWGIRKTGR